MIMTVMNGMMRMITRRLTVMINVMIMMKMMRMINNIMMRMSRVRIIETR